MKWEKNEMKWAEGDGKKSVYVWVDRENKEGRKKREKIFWIKHALEKEREREGEDEEEESKFPGLNLSLRAAHC